MTKAEFIEKSSMSANFAVAIDVLTQLRFQTTKNGNQKPVGVPKMALKLCNPLLKIFGFVTSRTQFDLLS